jgi:hypothetical protein
VSAFVLMAAASTAARQAPSVAGTWKLNEAASNNPNGPAPKAAADRRGGGGGAASGGARGGRGGGGGGFDVTGGAQAAQISELSQEEKARINMMLGLTNKAQDVLKITLEGGDVSITDQDGKGFPKQPADGKKNMLKNPQIGEVNIKVKIDNKGMTREITTQEDLKVVENYVVSADGKQLIVTVKESHPVMKIEDMKIKRVYDRQ